VEGEPPAAALHGNGQRGSLGPHAVAAGPQAQRTRLAVLLFQNLGGPEHEYFSDGSTEELISRLGRLAGDHVSESPEHRSSLQAEPKERRPDGRQSPLTLTAP
jgi:TolB-like protein